MRSVIPIIAVAALLLAAAPVAVAGDDRFEPNDTDDTAVAITAPVTHEGLSISSGDQDWFSLSLSTGDTIDVTVTDTDDTGNLGLGLWVAGDSLERVDFSNNYNANETLTLTADADGTYYVQVYFSAGSAVSYDLIVEGAASGSAPNAAPNASFTWTPTAPTEAETVTFDASGSSDSDGALSAYEWDFDGDGSGDATGETAGHAFAAGSHQVTLTVTDDAGATDTLTRTVSVAEATGGSITASRSAPATVTPGGEVTVTTTIDVPSDTNRLSLAERFSPAFEGVAIADASVTAGSGSIVTQIAEADGVDVATSGLAAGSTIEVTYDVSVGQNATVGDAFELTGTVTAGEATVDVGTSTITVATGPSVADYANPNGVIDTDGLRSAIADWATAGIDTDMLRSVITNWATGQPV